MGSVGDATDDVVVFGEAKNLPFLRKEYQFSGINIYTEVSWLIALAGATQLMFGEQMETFLVRRTHKDRETAMRLFGKGCHTHLACTPLYENLVFDVVINYMRTAAWINVRERNENSIAFGYTTRKENSFEVYGFFFNTLGTDQKELVYYWQEDSMKLFAMAALTKIVHRRKHGEPCEKDLQR